MKKEELERQGREYRAQYTESDKEDSFVMVKEKKPLHRQLEEGIYNIKDEDYDGERLRESSVVLGASQTLQEAGQDR
jgi:hypothetical protein